MVNNYTLKTQIDFIASEELELELEILNQFKDAKEPSSECLNSILQFASAFNTHSSAYLKDVNYLAN
jgi:hypothetical protein